ncbi:hypothetical protein PRO82_001936 [Candidatus Protochlamydia amoebophila]|nr:hypothetical protein [Candidatus Protochlamydia amoebophila]
MSSSLKFLIYRIFAQSKISISHLASHLNDGKKFNH